MSRLPVIGADNNQWATILNDFLNVGHNADGTIKGNTWPGQLALSAAGMWPSTTSGAIGVALTEQPTNKVNVYTMDFVDGSTTSGECNVIMPSNWDGGFITATFVWMANDTTTNAVTWGFQGYAYTDGAALDQAMGAQQTITDANAGVANQIRISSPTPNTTIGGAPGPSTLVQYRVQRLGAAGGDTLTANARLLGVMLTYVRQ